MRRSAHLLYGFPIGVEMEWPILFTTICQMQDVYTKAVEWAMRLYLMKWHRKL